jgi:hypothetical protein
LHKCFLQGTRDKLAELHLLRSVVETLGPRATLHVVDDADHSFHLPPQIAEGICFDFASVDP